MKTLTPTQMIICATSGICLMFILIGIYEAKTWKELIDDDNQWWIGS